MTHMDIVVIGTGNFTLECAKAVLDSKTSLKGIISMPKFALPLNSANIKDFADVNKIPYFEFEDLNAEESVFVLRRLAPDYILSSWPKILGTEVLKIPRRCVIGSHPTDLPFNRGRHPLHWLIVQGIRQTSLSFFRMDEGIDTGEILLKIPVEIQEDDTILNLADKINRAAYLGVEIILENDNSFQGSMQDSSGANYWRKRTPFDVTLDLRMTADHIIRTVQSFTLPYPCANLIINDKILKVLFAQIVINDFQENETQRIEPGKVISVEKKKMKIKAADKVVELTFVEELPRGLIEIKYIHPPMKYFVEFLQQGQQHFAEGLK
jgi:methionyl-tRNA formyltransferase